VRVAEPPPGPLGWAWCPGRRLGAATWPGSNCYKTVLAILAVPNRGLFGAQWDVLCGVDGIQGCIGKYDFLFCLN